MKATKVEIITVSYYSSIVFWLFMLASKNKTVFKLVNWNYPFISAQSMVWAAAKSHESRTSFKWPQLAWPFVKQQTDFVDRLRWSGTNVCYEKVPEVSWSCLGDNHPPKCVASSSEQIWICLECGMVRVFIERTSSHLQIMDGSYPMKIFEMR